MTANPVDAVGGGRGGDAQANPGAAGGRGGNGGPAGGIVVVATPDATIQWNTITSVTGGSGGAGGGSATTTAGGRGGDAGTAVAIEVASSTGTNWLSTNTVDSVVGGNGGPGGNGGTTNGNGGGRGRAGGGLPRSPMEAGSRGQPPPTRRCGIRGGQRRPPGRPARAAATAASATAS